MQVNLFAAENAVNTKVIEDLLCFIYDDGGRDKISLRVSDLSRGETLLTICFDILVYDLFLKSL